MYFGTKQKLCLHVFVNHTSDGLYLCTTLALCHYVFMYHTRTVSLCVFMYNTSPVSLCILVEEWCHMSGVLGVVVLGLTMNAGRTMISPEVEQFLHRYVLIGFLVQTLTSKYTTILFITECSI